MSSLKFAGARQSEAKSLEIEISEIDAEWGKPLLEIGRSVLKAIAVIVAFVTLEAEVASFPDERLGAMESQSRN